MTAISVTAIICVTLVILKLLNQRGNSRNG